MTEKRQSHLVEETGDKACVYSSHSNTNISTICYRPVDLVLIAS